MCVCVRACIYIDIVRISKRKNIVPDSRREGARCRKVRKVITFANTTSCSACRNNKADVEGRSDDQIQDESTSAWTLT